MGFSGIIAYILAAIIMPERPVNVPPAKDVYEANYAKKEDVVDAEIVDEDE